MVNVLKIGLLTITLFLVGSAWTPAQAAGDRAVNLRSDYHHGGYGYHPGPGAYHRPYPHRHPYYYGYHRSYPYRVHAPYYYRVRPYPHYYYPPPPFPYYPGW